MLSVEAALLLALALVAAELLAVARLLRLLTALTDMINS
jgi:vacuolar-type H+-ATPase subunit B/Vma2